MDASECPKVGTLPRSVIFGGFSETYRYPLIKKYSLNHIRKPIMKEDSLIKGYWSVWVDCGIDQIAPWNA